LRAQLAARVAHDRAAARPLPADGALLPAAVRWTPRLQTGRVVHVGAAAVRRPSPRSQRRGGVLGVRPSAREDLPPQPQADLRAVPGRALCTAGTVSVRLT